MRELVALDCAGETFVVALRRAWDNGDAVAPLDPRLPGPARAAVVAALRPTAIVDHRGDRTVLQGGDPVEAGDALVVATSSTTGRPKGVVLTHDAVRASAIATTRGSQSNPTVIVGSPACRSCTSEDWRSSPGRC